MKIFLKIFIILFLYPQFLTINAQTQQSSIADYYVSNSSGNDNNSGTDQEHPWKTVRKVNNSLPQGKKVAFKRGDIFLSPIKAKRGCTYGAYGTGNKPKFGNKNSHIRFFDIVVDNVTIENIEIESSSWVRINDADYLTIDNCYFHHYIAPGMLEADAEHVANNPLLVRNSDYFTLKNSDIRGNYNSVYQDMIVIELSCQYSLIENNYINGGSHTSLYMRGSFKNQFDKEYNDTSPNHTIIRNNHFFNHSHHSLGVNVGAWLTLIENNYFERSGTGIDSSKIYNRTYANDGTIGSAIYNYGSGIMRYNIVRRTGSNKNNRAIDGLVRYAKDGRRSEVFDQAIYNNVFWDNWSEGYKTGIYYNVKYSYPNNLVYKNISFVNNIFAGSKNPTNEDLYIYKANVSQNFIGDYRNNSFEKPMIRYGAGTYKALKIKNFNTSPPGNITASSNLHIAPKFASPNLIPKNVDVKTAFNYFKLSSNSSLIDAGDFLTFTSNSGSNSNKIKVKDAKFFIDGWGIVDGDNIQIDNEILKITKVDYINNILTVDRNISWNKNTGIALPYSGNKPDIGAVEYTGTSNEHKEKTNTPQTPTITQQPTNINAKSGDNITLSVIASCNEPIGYQWWKTPFVSIEESKIVNGPKYSGATTNSLTIKNIDNSDNGTKYICEIYNTQDHENHKVNSNIATINVVTESLTPTITQQPSNQSVTTGEEVTLTVSATCNNSIGYQWWKTPFVSVKESKIVNSSKYSGATTNKLTIKNINDSDNGQKFVCEVYNTQDHNNHWVNSEAATILVTIKQNLISNLQSNIKVFLEGAFQGNKMKTTLLNNGYLPINQPFNISPYNFAAFQKVNAFPNTIVDWVLVELRTGLTTKAKRFAALLNNDGHVLNLDGSNNFSNQNIPDGNYYLVIYHRNHLPIMSSNIINIKNSVINYDFTTNINKAYGKNALIKLPNGIFAMYAGDSDKNKKINDSDYIIIKNNIFSTGYKDGDIDMNGIVNILDYSNINKNISIKSNVP